MRRTGSVLAATERLREVHERTGCLADGPLDALPAAATIDGPLSDEPVTVKDWIDVTGFRCSGGSLEHRERRPARDATAVARLRAAGAVVVAKTAVQPVSDCFGVVRHPHDPRLSPGGSSSGDAVAVASGAVRLGLGSDSGGSVRVPAAWCGVVGFKPSYGLVPTTGHFPRVGDRSDGRTVLGPLAATVDLAWTAVQVMAGPDGLDSAVAPASLGDPSSVDLGSLRVAVGVPGVEQVDDEVASALEQARRVLVAAGGDVSGDVPDWTADALRVTEAYWHRDERSGEQVCDDLVDWDRFRHRVLLETRDVDVLITPVVAGTAPVHRAMQVADFVFCLPPSLLGTPAVSVPVGTSAVQVVARRWSDHVAVAVARVLERGG